MALFSDYEDDPDKLNEELVFWALMFVAIGGINFIGNVGAMSFFGKSGEELTMRLRSKDPNFIFCVYLYYTRKSKKTPE